ncbi:hypothetical protein BTN49_0319 (plasmid) [Candidatus Enterovibrio escicola]|uniref:Uncharacterized protein n=1 Tax=Candidatus Enterovibrio escicola TaxID=1927127 RepID=A0A2A5T703_9GAMM|nr:hypothetical protein BTN49_0319 [Candidatus Enterovibrio escacola]
MKMNGNPINTGRKIGVSDSNFILPLMYLLMRLFLQKLA